MNDTEVNDAEPADGEEHSEPVIVPWQELSADALRGVVESFILREGTDYGEQEASMQTKVTQVLRQLERGEAGVAFDPTTESVSIVATTPVSRRSRE